MAPQKEAPDAKHKSRPPLSIPKQETSARISKRSTKRTKGVHPAIVPPWRRVKGFLPEPPPAWVQRLDNGLVDMSEIPPWLIALVKRNAEQSPLLRLPGELRNKIFDYVMTGHAVQMTEDRDRIVVNNKTKVREKFFYKGHTIDIKGLQQVNPRSRYRHPRRRYPPSLDYIPLDGPTSERPTSEQERVVESTFHLPEVCRQIYTETAILAYPGTIFYFPKEKCVFKEIDQWSRGLLPAQRNVITDIAVKKSGIADYFKGRSSSSFLESLPDLKRIHIYDNGLDPSGFNWTGLGGTTACGTTASLRHKSTTDYTEWARRRMYQLGNENVEVVYYPMLD